MPQALASLDPPSLLRHNAAMDAYSDSVQRIARLTPLGDVLALIEARVAPVAPRQMPPAAGLGRTLAADVLAPRALPPVPQALRDGFAVAAELIGDAGPYAPVPLPGASARVDDGDALPAGCDAVAPLDAVTGGGLGAQAVAPVGPGEGVLPAGGDAEVGAVLARAGDRLTRTRVAMLAACGVETISARVAGVRVCRAAARPDLVAPASDLIAQMITACGATLLRDAESETSLEAGLKFGDADALIAIGGTGSGRHDTAITALQRAAELAVHGVAISPGETAALGFADARPVLLLPGRIDAALAAFLLLGAPLLRRLAGRSEDEPTFSARLTRKVASTLGLAELVPVRRRGDEVEPLARGHLPLAALARADGWILVGAESEGFPPGTAVKVHPFP